jgi:hypothetical protein
MSCIIPSAAILELLRDSRIVEMGKRVSAEIDRKIAELGLPPRPVVTREMAYAARPKAGW